MSLVDYASSDEESENETEVKDIKKPVETEENLAKSNESNNRVGDNLNCDNNGELFTSLPKPRKSFSFLDDDNKLSKLLLNKNSLPSGRKESVKISVPSVSEFDDESEQPASKKIKPSTKGAGLFSILPPPKNPTVKQTIRNLVPHAVSKNQVKSNFNRTELKNKVVNSISTKGADDEDDGDDTLVGSSFFGSTLIEQNSHSQPEYLNSEQTVEEETTSNLPQPSNSFANEQLLTGQTSNIELLSNDSNYNYNNATEPSLIQETLNASDNPLDLDEKALQILCGNKKKRQHMPMNVIDLSGEEVLPDSKEWLLKQFTEEKRGRGHSHKKSQGFSSQSRRKHQITYLAYQAKEQELELQNQWAANRMSRKQTQSKYGF